MNLFARDSSPLAADSSAALSLPRVRMGLLTKLNLLTIGLLFVTTIATTGFYLWQQWRDENTELHRRGTATLAMLAELAEFGLATGNRAHVDAILDTLSANADIAYVVVLDAKREPIASRRIGERTVPPHLRRSPQTQGCPSQGRSSRRT
jgi:sensor histidine kinase regulating citrate/malate metabolism